MKYPAGNLLLGGVGRPGFKQVLVGILCGEPLTVGEGSASDFGKVVAAINSHKQVRGRSIVLVVERACSLG
jgi:hypothetical protein